jgi:hypothetical protein
MFLLPFYVKRHCSTPQSPDADRNSHRGVIVLKIDVTD